MGNALLMHVQGWGYGHLRACPWKILRALLASGVDVNRACDDANGSTPLMRACANLPHPMEAVRLLAPGPCPHNVFFMIQNAHIMFSL